MFIQLLRSMRSRCLTLQRPLCRRTDSPLLWPPRVQGPQSKKPRLKSKKNLSVCAEVTFTAVVPADGSPILVAALD